jgi:hypothetical protein
MEVLQAGAFADFHPRELRVFARGEAQNPAPLKIRLPVEPDYRDRWAPAVERGKV